MKAVVLLSGGLDSTVAAAWALREGFAVEALSIDYGQRHRIELDAARAVAQALGIARHVVIALDLRAFGGSALTADIAVPKAGVEAGIPVTYVPARNTVFLALALAMAEAAGARDLVIGVNALDYSGYPDCRPAFIAAFEAMAATATRTGIEGGAIRVRTPLIAMTKAEIVRLGLETAAPLHLTRSCYDPAGDRPCRLCDSCRLRAKGFAGAGVTDPAP